MRLSPAVGALLNVLLELDPTRHLSPLHLFSRLPDPQLFQFDENLTKKSGQMLLWPFFKRNITMNRRERCCYDNIMISNVVMINFIFVNLFVTVAYSYLIYPPDNNLVLV